MTQFRKTPLCTFPAGPKSGSQTRKARELIRQAVPGGKEVNLIPVTDVQEQTHSLTAWFDASDPVAAAWVEKASREAEGIRERVMDASYRDLLR